MWLARHTIRWASGRRRRRKKINSFPFHFPSPVALGSLFVCLFVCLFFFRFLFAGSLTSSSIGFITGMKKVVEIDERAMTLTPEGILQIVDALERYSINIEAMWRIYTWNWWVAKIDWENSTLWDSISFPALCALFFLMKVWGSFGNFLKKKQPD